MLQPLIYINGQISCFLVFRFFSRTVTSQRASHIKTIGDEAAVAGQELI